MKALLSITPWERLIRHLLKHRVLGVTANVTAGHPPPWTVTPSWDGERWVCAIQPGLVNGIPATWEGVDLLEAPVIPIRNYRALGPDATPQISTDAGGNVTFSYEPVPAYFQSLGVGRPPVSTFDPFAGGLSTETDFEGRLLRSADLVLHQSRMSATTDITVDDPLSGATTIIEFATSYEGLSTANDPATIEQTEKYSPPVENDPLAQFLGLLEGKKEDQILIASLWWVSPPQWPHGSPLDGSWDVYVQQKLWRNLDHATKAPPPQLAQSRLKLDTGLAGGVGDRLNDYLTAQLNTTDSQFAQFFNAQDTPGKFWSV